MNLKGIIFRMGNVMSFFIFTRDANEQHNVKQKLKKAFLMKLFHTCIYIYIMYILF